MNWKALRKTVNLSEVDWLQVAGIMGLIAVLFVIMAVVGGLIGLLAVGMMMLTQYMFGVRIDVGGIVFALIILTYVIMSLIDRYRKIKREMEREYENPNNVGPTPGI